MSFLPKLPFQRPPPLTLEVLYTSSLGSSCEVSVNALVAPHVECNIKPLFVELHSWQFSAHWYLSAGLRQAPSRPSSPSLDIPLFIPSHPGLCFHLLNKDSCMSNFRPDLSSEPQTAAGAAAAFRLPDQPHRSQFSSSLSLTLASSLWAQNPALKG